MSLLLWFDHNICYYIPRMLIIGIHPSPPEAVMLVEFRFKNFRSFKGEAVLSMLPIKAYKEHPSNLLPVAPKGTGAQGILSTAAIYGPNASGKSNILRAIDYARALILGLARPAAPGGAPAFVGSEDEPNEFCFCIVAGGARYDYELAVRGGGVVREELRTYPKGDRLVFRRSALPGGSYEVEQGSYYPGIASRLRGFSDGGPVLGLLAKYGIRECSDVYDWFSERLVVRNQAATPLSYPDVVERLRGLSSRSFERVVDALRAADLGIRGVQLAVEPLTEEEREQQRVLLEKASAVYAAITGEEPPAAAAPGEKVTFQLQHLIGGRSVGFGFDDESFGTVTMLALAADLLDAMERGQVLAIDEIERSLHPVLLRRLVGLFSDRHLNDKNAQLVFTTHSLSLMAGDLLRRDQIWFVEKSGETGESDLYSLAAFSPRKDDSVLNRYLRGAYGAVPYDGEGLIDD